MTLSMSDIELNDFANADFSEFVNSLEESHECPICLESFNLASNNLTKTCCNHYYCKPCYNKINKCGLCRTSFNKIQPDFNDSINKLPVIIINTVSATLRHGINVKFNNIPRPKIIISPWINPLIESNQTTTHN